MDKTVRQQEKETREQDDTIVRLQAEVSTLECALPPMAAVRSPPPETRPAYAPASSSGLGDLMSGALGQVDAALDREAPS